MNIADLSASSGSANRVSAFSGSANRVSASSGSANRATNTARDFEAMVMGQLMQPMFETMGDDPIFGGGAGEEAFKGLLVQEYGKLAATRGGLGLANSLSGLLHIQEAAR